MTSVSSSKRFALLVLGDLIAYVFSLVMTLFLRYGHIPSKNLLYTHLVGFSVLFAVFLIINFSAGLYDKPSAIIRGRIGGILAKVQIINAIIGVIFFYFAPVSIAPKANLFIFFAVSTAALFVWRMVMFPVVSVTRRQGAVLVGAGKDMDDLREEIESNPRYGLVFRERILPQESTKSMAEAIGEAVKRNKASVIVADLHNQTVESAMPFLYTLVFSGVQIIDAGKLYESIFDRIPLTLVGDKWLVENSGTALGTRRAYDIFKRVMDIVISVIIGIVFLILYPFVFIAIKLDDGGPIFISQNRIGIRNLPIRVTKFRTMSSNDNGSYGNGGKSRNRVTRIGKFLRLTRIDELPQVWSVLKGNQSLIGPRPELPSLAAIYEKEIPYYNVRHLIKPGLSGWAQIYHRAHPHHAVAVEDTKDKLSYDLFYIKNRSLALDLRIALQTLKSIVSRQGV